MENRRIAITGSIGSGKSVVQNIVKAMGFPVYDCDREARNIMDNDKAIIRTIAEEISATAVKEGRIDRKALSAIVFSDKDRLARLNALVHRAVIDDYRTWSRDRKISFVESAILFSSKLYQDINEIWEVKAPESLRIVRVSWRNPELSRSDIVRRIEAQKIETEAIEQSDIVRHIIVNDDSQAILPQIEALL